MSMSKAKTIAQTEQVGALRQAQWNETDWAADRLGLNTAMLWLSALKPTTGRLMGQGMGKRTPPKRCRLLFENGNRYNCYCSQFRCCLTTKASFSMKVLPRN
jgi:hypothetical protein